MLSRRREPWLGPSLQQEGKRGLSLSVLINTWQGLTSLHAMNSFLSKIAMFWKALSQLLPVDLSRVRMWEMGLPLRFPSHWQCPWLAVGGT